MIGSRRTRGGHFEVLCNLLKDGLRQSLGCRIRGLGIDIIDHLEELANHVSHSRTGSLTDIAAISCTDELVVGLTQRCQFGIGRTTCSGPLHDLWSGDAHTNDAIQDTSQRCLWGCEVRCLLYTVYQTEGDVIHTADVTGIGLAQLSIIARLTVLLSIVDGRIEQEILRARRDKQGIDLAGVGCPTGMGRLRFP